MSENDDINYLSVSLLLAINNIKILANFDQRVGLK